MGRTLRLLVAASMLAVVLTPTAATAVVLDRDKGFDPRDVETGHRFEPDISSTTRRLAIHDGRRVLAIGVRFYDPVAGWPLEILLDARGGPRVDHLMNTFGEECFVWRRGHRRDAMEGRAVARGRRFVCRVPARVVSPTKSIRWKVRTGPPEDPDDSFEVDYAPSDRGWYG
jgi:hypothetical protein